MRDADLDVQSDLILLQDKSVETDGTITIRQENVGGCETFGTRYCTNLNHANVSVVVLMTQTIGQMTEGVMLSDIATQTAPPKNSLAFGRFLYKDNCPVHPSDSAISIDDIINKNEKILRAQIAELNQLDTKSQSNQHQKGQRNGKTIVSDDSLSSEISDGDASYAEIDDKLHASSNQKFTSKPVSFRHIVNLKLLLMNSFSVTL